MAPEDNFVVVALTTNNNNVIFFIHLDIIDLIVSSTQKLTYYVSWHYLACHTNKCLNIGITNLLLNLFRTLLELFLALPSQDAVVFQVIAKSSVCIPANIPCTVETRKVQQHPGSVIIIVDLCQLFLLYWGFKTVSSCL